MRPASAGSQGSEESWSGEWGRAVVSCQCQLSERGKQSGTLCLPLPNRRRPRRPRAWTIDGQSSLRGEKMRERSGQRLALLAREEIENEGRRRGRRRSRTRRVPFRTVPGSPGGRRSKAGTLCLPLPNRRPRLFRRMDWADGVGEPSPIRLEVEEQSGDALPTQPPNAVPPLTTAFHFAISSALKLLFIYFA